MIFFNIRKIVIRHRDGANTYTPHLSRWSFADLGLPTTQNCILFQNTNAKRGSNGSATLGLRSQYTDQIISVLLP